MTKTYEEKWPVGSQTVTLSVQNMYVANTKKVTGWYVSRPLFLNEITEELRIQKLKLDTYYDRKQR